MRCEEKKAYKSEKSAGNTSRRLFVKYGHTGLPYRCKCKKWHLGTARKAVYMRYLLRSGKKLKVEKYYYYSVIPIRKMRFWERWWLKISTP